MTFNPDKFANAVVFLLTECPRKPGLTALLKMLFRADFQHYREHLAPITGVDYVALARGPVPQDYRLLMGKLEALGRVARQEVSTTPTMNDKVSYVPLGAPTNGALSESELAVLRSVVREHGNKTGAQPSEETHNEPPWRDVWQDGEGNGQRIPYALARAEENRCGPDDLDAAKRDIAAPAVQQFIAEFAAQ